MSKKDDLKRLEPKYPNQVLNVVIPLGVSVNHLYIFKKGKRFMTKKGQDYMKQVMQIVDNAVKSQGYKLEEEGVWMICELTYYFPDKRRRDCHNQHKLVMDALEYVAFKEDRWVLVRDMYVGLDKELPRIEVKLYPQKVVNNVDISNQRNGD
jgi:crossover junction endodeoxyribonuclease RusA